MRHPGSGSLTRWGVTAGAAAVGGGLGWLAERRWLDPSRRGPVRPVQVPPADRELAVTADDGTRLHVEVRGPGAAASGGDAPAGDGGAPTLVLSHGWTTQIAFWRAQLADLSDRWRVVAYDHRGHGRSQMPVDDDFSTEALAGDLGAVIHATVPADERCVVVSHSMGGMALLALSEAHPAWVRDRLAGSVLISTGANDLFRRNAISRGSAIADAVGCVLVPWLLGTGGPVADGPVGAGSDVMFYGTREVALHSGADASLTAEVERLVLDCPPASRARFAETLSSLDLSEGIPRVPGPALVIVGERDRLTPPRQSAVVAASRPDAELIVLPGVGHMAPLEAAEVVNARLDAFAAAVLAPAGGRGDAAPARATAAE